jgi:hypothetical protein
MDHPFECLRRGLVSATKEKTMPRGTLITEDNIDDIMKGLDRRSPVDNSEIAALAAQVKAEDRPRRRAKTEVSAKLLRAKTRYATK